MLRKTSIVFKSHDELRSFRVALDEMLENSDKAFDWVFLAYVRHQILLKEIYVRKRYTFSFHLHDGMLLFSKLTRYKGNPQSFEILQVQKVIHQLDVQIQSIIR